MEVFSNPTVAAILGGIAGALIAGFFSVAIWRWTRTKKRIRAVIRDVTSLLEINETLKSNLDIKNKGEKIESLFLTSIDVSNVGNASIENQQIMITLSDGSKIIGFSITTQPTNGFEDVAIVDRTHQLVASVPLLNCREQITFEIISTGNLSKEVEINMRNTDVEEQVIDARSGDLGLAALLSEQNLLLLAVVSAVPFFGGFARSMINVGVANRIDNLSRKTR